MEFACLVVVAGGLRECDRGADGEKQAHPEVAFDPERVGQTRKRCGNCTDLALIPSLSIKIVTKREKSSKMDEVV